MLFWEGFLRDLVFWLGGCIVCGWGEQPFVILVEVFDAHLAALVSFYDVRR